MAKQKSGSGKQSPKGKAASPKPTKKSAKPTGKSKGVIARATAPVRKVAAMVTGKILSVVPGHGVTPAAKSKPTKKPLKSKPAPAKSATPAAPAPVKPARKAVSKGPAVAAPKPSAKITAKPTVANRGVNTGKKPPEGAPFSNQDVKRRLGNFTGAGEPPRKGSRSAGIVGQTKQKNKTDKKSK